MLQSIDARLKASAEAICDAHMWRTYGEGSAPVAEGLFTGLTDKLFTPEAIRFAVNGDKLCPTSLCWPKYGRETTCPPAGERSVQKNLRHSG